MFFSCRLGMSRILPILGLSVLNIDPKDDFLLQLRESNENEVQKYAFLEHGITYLQWTREEIVRNFWFNRYFTPTNKQIEQQQLSQLHWNEWFGNKVTNKRLQNINQLDRLADEMEQSMHQFQDNGNPFDIDILTTPWWKMMQTLDLATWNIFPILYGTKIVADLMKNRKDINILDIGCGTGVFGAILTKYISDKTIVNLLGIDGSKYVINTVNQKYMFLDVFYDTILNLNICHPDFEDLEINYKFDIVISMELLFHSAVAGLPGVKAVKDCMKFVNDDGFFIVINGLAKADLGLYATLDDCLEDYLKENNFECVMDEIIVYDKYNNGDSIDNILDKTIQLKGIDLNEYDMGYQASVVRVFHKNQK
eukprot:241831_1